MQILILIYALATILIGIFYGIRTKNTNQYSIGSRNHSTIIIVAIILSAFIGGPLLITRSSFAYNVNTTYILASFGTFFSIIFYYYLAPLLFTKYSDKVSVGEIIESSYGKNARIITGLCGTISSLMLIAAHIKVLAILLEYIFNVNILYGSIICTIFVSSYSIMGGTRFISVNTIFQFYTLLIVIPLFFGSTIEKFGGITNFFQHSSIRSLDLSLLNINLIKFLSLFFIYSIPYFGYGMTSIILSGKDSKQSSSAFLRSSFIFLALSLIFTLTGLIAYTINPNIISKISFFYVAEHISIDYKALIVVGMISIIISSIDLFLNNSSVALIHDVLKVIARDRINEKLELKLFKISTLFLMILSLVFSLLIIDFYKLIRYSHILWAPIITIPLIASIFTTPKKLYFYSSIIISVITIMIWNLLNLEKTTLINPIIPSMLVSILIFFLKSYIVRVFNILKNR